MIKRLKNLFKRKEEEEEQQTTRNVPKWRNELTVYLKSGGKTVLWSETTDGMDDAIYDSWDELLEWFELKTNKPYFRFVGRTFKTVLVRDNIASIMTIVTKVN